MLREEKKRKTKEAIVRHAVELFKHKGFDQVTVDEITQACGIGKGTFFNYFAKKEHILLHVADSYAELLGRIVGRHQEGPLQERLLGVFRELLAIYSGHSNLLRLALAETVKAAVEGKEQGDNLTILQTAIRGVIQESVAEGSFRSRSEPDTIASILVALLLHALMTGNDEAQPESIASVFETLMRAAWEGIVHE